MPEDAKGLLFAVGLSIVFIYLLMAFLFESFVLPLSIVLTIPLAFLGVAWGHMVSGLDMDFLGMVGSWSSSASSTTASSSSTTSTAYASPATSAKRRS